MDRNEASREEIATRVREIFAAFLGRELVDIDEAADLEADLGLDSLDKIELSMELEEEFYLELAEEVLESTHTVADVIDAICNAE